MLRSTIWLIFEPSRTLLSLLSLESEGGRCCSLFKGLTTPILFACAIQTCILLSLESFFKWLGTISSSPSSLIPSDVFLACRNLSLAFLLSLQRCRLSPKGSLMPSLPSCMALLALYLHIFWLLASLCQHGCLLPFLRIRFYHSNHRTQISWSFTRFIHVILSRKQFNISKVILDAMTPLYDPSYW